MRPGETVQAEILPEQMEKMEIILRHRNAKVTGTRTTAEGRTILTIEKN